MEKFSVSNAFQVFMTETPEFSGPWMEAVHKLDAASQLEPKTKTLAYLAVLAATRLESGIPFHVKHAKSLGATRDEVLSVILVGLPAVGHAVTQCLPAALKAYDED